MDSKKGASIADLAVSARGHVAAFPQPTSPLWLVTHEPLFE
jgi:hypothetical protein